MITQKAKTTKSLEPIEVKINKTKYHVKRRQNEKKKLKTKTIILQTRPRN